MQIPADMAPSIGNCQILSVEYFLEVRLDIKFSFDPKIKFPVVIMPPGSIAIHQSGGAVGPYPPGTMVGHQSTGLFHHPLSTFPAPYPAHYGLVNPPQPMPPYPAMPGQAAYPLPQQIYPFPVANGLPQAASMNTSQFP
ncbi:hypothetical protein NHX12_029336 [Muraenolepis orangiensis]|uniref:Arrestin C-terminal-like domain-containing protein n=1 Tax=Muraenolepis orangiensis TaxID=630683 RepID=A0A9Q0ED45_9TELE|nr:hypothetical protein NHX12_029336 [Muraenolepis orangiensis]